MDIKLREGELILKEGEIVCPVCKGAGYTEKNIYVCEKCDGSGKVDWVANAMVRKKEERSTLDELNIRRIFIHLRSLIDNLKFEPLDDTTINNLRETMEHYLSSLESRKAIYDYQVSEALPSSQGRKCFDINVKTTRSVEMVQMNVVIK